MVTMKVKITKLDIKALRELLIYNEIRLLQIKRNSKTLREIIGGQFNDSEYHESILENKAISDFINGRIDLLQIKGER